MVTFDGQRLAWRVRFGGQRLARRVVKNFIHNR